MRTRPSSCVPTSSTTSFGKTQRRVGQTGTANCSLTQRSSSGTNGGPASFHHRTSTLRNVLETPRAIRFDAPPRDSAPSLCMRALYLSAGRAPLPQNTWHPGDANVRILSIDGGGYLGLATASFL